jgi:hypothetical protein
VPDFAFACNWRDPAHSRADVLQNRDIARLSHVSLVGTAHKLSYQLTDVVPEPTACTGMVDCTSVFLHSHHARSNIIINLA